MAETVTELAGTNANLPTLPKEVQLYREDLTSASFTPRQLRAVRETLGRSYASVMSDQESDERFLVMAWLKLQEELGAFPIELMDDVIIRVKVDADGTIESAPPDPFDVASSRPSSPSVGTGG